MDEMTMRHENDARNALEALARRGYDREQLYELVDESIGFVEEARGDAS